MKLSFRAQLAIMTASVLLVTLVVIGCYAAVSGMQVVRDVTDRGIRQTSSLIDQRVGALLNTAESQSRLLSSLLSPGGDRVPARTLSNEFPRLAEEMVAMVKVNPQFGFLSVSIADTGDYLQVVRQPDGTLLVQSSRLDSRGRRRREDYVPRAGTLELTHVSPNWGFDPRTRPFFVAAQAAQRQVWVTNNEGDDTTPQAPAVTCATPLFDGHSRLLAVVTVDFTLGGLNRFIQTTTFGESGYAFLAEERPGRIPRIIAHPGEKPPQPGVPDQSRFAPSARLLQVFNDDHKPLGPTEVRRVSLKWNGTRYIGSYQRVTGENTPDWVMFLLAPTTDFTGSLRETAGIMILFSFFALGVGCVASFVLAHRVAQPLQALSAETERIRALEFEPRPLPPTSIIEVDQLASATEQMKTALRSFEKLVPAEYARRLMASGQEAKLGGKRERLTVYFADLMGFTAFAEALPPEGTVELLSDYLDTLSSVVAEMGGTVDKFNGDDVMAFFGAPTPMAEHALAACRAALLSCERVADLHTSATEQGRTKLLASFGICTGPVVVGNIGSRHRMNYTVIGDAANLASRIQGLNRFYRTLVLLDEQANGDAGDAIVSRPIDTVTVFGRSSPAQVYELMALRENADEETLRVARMHTEGMALYQGRQWDAAIDLFQQVLVQRPNDGPAQLLLARCLSYRISPPGPTWDGTHRMEIK